MAKAQTVEEEASKQLPVTEDNTKKRYNERDITKNFLRSGKGFKLLLEIGRKYKYTNSYSSSSDVLKEIECLIDIYSTWTGSFPVRKNLKISKYDFLKHVEDFCLERENAEDLEKIVDKSLM
ncbi:uncharacterized protein VICG_01658 [Vittaforma corneae ATCC 50505]|uniref:Uncharacterized protein n=1 Tax=Vittaforma corneae (strain ATCC 50505) TaxID=993615 RepID=L2GLA1_VITCO|nr:uncharacterized protein VICG_01658 [Vittaforma corneae ATCC 50505]ELA41285.1 hypothetical protein VICG_01658 [Vittaforma corneae ATCC 50505]